eukprot:TRINITY_DN20096_c0_g2_i1.p1 TRINITY_DN20096_c0_g2~~TRINITY_DN20096_c0_g2_i1.p1  ORF type:complete len:314 (-),score=59.23 TRINITY_DN20096_c0_g2_i1:428-1369(-)
MSDAAPHEHSDPTSADGEPVVGTMDPRQEFESFFTAMFSTALNSPLPETRALAPEIKVNGTLALKQLSNELLDSTLTELDQLDCLETQADKLKKMACFATVCPCPEQDPAPEAGGGTNYMPWLAALVLVLLMVFVQDKSYGELKEMAGALLLLVSTGVQSLMVWIFPAHNALLRHQIVNSAAAAAQLDSPQAAQCVAQCEQLCEAPWGGTFEPVVVPYLASWSTALELLEKHHAGPEGARLVSLDMVDCIPGTMYNCTAMSRVFPSTRLKAIKNGGCDTIVFAQPRLLQARWVSGSWSGDSSCIGKCVQLCGT